MPQPGGSENVPRPLPFPGLNFLINKVGIRTLSCQPHRAAPWAQMENSEKAVHGPGGQAVLRTRTFVLHIQPAPTPGAAGETDLSAEEGPGAGQGDDEGD